MIRGRIGNLMICAGLATLLIGMSWGSAHAQTKIVKPANGGVLVISKSGSYFLAANYISALKAASIITVNVNNVTINLNGFTITDTAIANTSTAINAAGDSGVTIVNGTITKTGTAIVLGTSSTVGAMQLIGNSGDGIICASTCLITNNVITGNGGVGLNFLGDTSSGYQDNIISGNGGGNVTGGTNLGNNVCGSAACPVPPAP